MIGNLIRNIKRYRLMRTADALKTALSPSGPLGGF